jgi:hypothetical protein
LGLVVVIMTRPFFSCDPLFKLILTPPSKSEMGMAIDQARNDQAPMGIDSFQLFEMVGKIGFFSHPHKFSIFPSYSSFVEQMDLILSSFHAAAG